jgi:predicted nucleic acid-binding protein
VATPRDPFVLDASVALAWCFADEKDPFADAVAGRFPGVVAVVPNLWHLEVANIFVTAERRGRCTHADIVAWYGFLAGLPITVDDRTPTAAWGTTTDLARTHQLSAYDAAYLELALRLPAPLATLDKKLETAARAAGVGLFVP